MKEIGLKRLLLFFIILSFGFTGNGFSQKSKGPMDPMEKDAIGINAELGYNINYAQIGMTFKLH